MQSVIDMRNGRRFGPFEEDYATEYARTLNAYVMKNGVFPPPFYVTAATDEDLCPRSRRILVVNGGDL